MRSADASKLFPNETRGNHLVARFDGIGQPVLLLGHFDTVWPVGTLASDAASAARPGGFTVLEYST